MRAYNPLVSKFLIHLLWEKAR